MKTSKLLLALCFTSMTLHVDAVMIHRNYIEQHVRDAARNYLSTLGFSTSSIPERFMAEYESHINDAVAALKRIADYGGRSYVDDLELESIVPQEIARFAETLKTIVQTYHLDQKVTECIHAYLKNNNLTPDTIPSSMVSDYHRKGQQIVQKLRNIMSGDGRNYVRVGEIENAVSAELSSFVDRVKSARNQTPHTGNSWNLWDWFTGNSSNNTSYQNAPTTQYGITIKRYELDNKVLESVYKVLRENNIDPDNVPARVVSDYSDKVQKIIKRMRQTMSNNYRDYVYVSEVEQAAREELKSVIDKIRYVGETCSVCLDNYVKGQKVGLLSCGHTFHKDCVSAWLVDHKTCPLCRQYNVIVAQHEVVP